MANDPAKPRRNTRWYHGGDGYYRLFLGELQYAPEWAEGGMSPVEACTVEIDFLDEPEAIENTKRVEAILRDPSQEPELASPALDAFDALLHDPVKMAETLCLVWNLLDEENWNADNIDEIARAIGFEYSGDEWDTAPEEAPAAPLAPSIPEV